MKQRNLEIKYLIMHHLPHEEDIANHAVELLSITSTWLLVRHQWLVDTMRCMLTGEVLPPLPGLEEFDKVIPKHLKLSDHITESFTEIKIALEAHWLETTKTIHPLSGLTLFDQLNNYQASAHRFMQTSKEANQKLLHELAMRDSLTGAWTRLTLNNSLSQALKHAVKYKESCSIALLDQDKFKQINDRWGHVVGDEVLVHTAEIIQSNLRPGDKLFRFGGDEWLIIMPGTSEALGKKILDGIQEAYSNYAFSSNNNESFFSAFSYGIAESAELQTIKEWVIHADTNLYVNKSRAAA